MNTKGVRLLALCGLVLGLAMLYSGALHLCPNQQLLPEPHCNLPDTLLYRSQFFWTFLTILCITAMALTLRQPKSTRIGTARALNCHPSISQWLVRLPKGMLSPSPLRQTTSHFEVGDNMPEASLLIHEPRGI